MLSPLFSIAARLSLLAGCLAALPLAATASGAAAPGWLPAKILSTSSGDAVVPEVAADSRGDVAVVWTQAQGNRWTIQAAIRRAGRPWSKARAISAVADHVGSPHIVFDGRGNALSVWERFDGKNFIAESAAYDAATDTWSPPVALSRPGRDAVTPRIAVNARGEAVALWPSLTRSGWTMQAASRTARGVWGPPVDLENPLQGTGFPDVVVDPAGNAIAVWAQTSGAGFTVESSYRPVGGAWGEVTDLSQPGRSDSITPQVALEGGGGVDVVWARSTPTRTIVEEVVRSAAGAWSQPRRLSPPGPDAVAPAIVTNGRGAAAVVWTSSGKGGLAVVARYRRPGHDWGPAVTLSRSSSGPLSPQVALDGQGDVVVVWTRSNGGRSRVQAMARQAASGDWSAPKELSGPGSDALTPQLALDGQGDGALAWSRCDQKSCVVEAAGYDGSAPALDDLAVPARGAAGVPLTFSVAPLDVWSAVTSIRWSFGDGTAATGRRETHVYARPGRYAVRVTVSDSKGHVSTATRVVTIAARS